MAVTSLPVPVAWITADRVAGFAAAARLPGGSAQAIGLILQWWAIAARTDVAPGDVLAALPLAELRRIADPPTVAAVIAIADDPGDEPDPLFVALADNRIGLGVSRASVAWRHKSRAAGKARSASHTARSAADASRGQFVRAATSEPAVAGSEPAVAGSFVTSLPITGDHFVRAATTEPAVAGSIVLDPTTEPAVAGSLYRSSRLPVEKPAVAGSEPAVAGSFVTSLPTPAMASVVLSEISDPEIPPLPYPGVPARSRSPEPGTARGLVYATPIKPLETHSVAPGMRTFGPAPENRATDPADPVLRDRRARIRSRIWAHLETSRQAVAARLGTPARPLMAQDPGEQHLAIYLLGVGGDLDRAEKDLAHAVDMAALEAEHRDRSVKWLTGGIFEPAKLRVLLGMTAVDAQQPRLPPRSAADRGSPAPGGSIRKVRTL